MRPRFVFATLAGVCLAGSMAWTAACADPPTTQKGHAYGHQSDLTTDTPGVKARMEMRKLWEDHIVFTHAYVISATSNLPDHILKMADAISAGIEKQFPDKFAQASN